MASSATAVLLRGIPFLRARALRAAAAALPRRYTSGLVPADEPQLPSAAAPKIEGDTLLQAKRCSKRSEYRQWKDKEEEILKDIEPIRILTKEILHSNRYMDGECLSAEDEKEVIEKLLAYHPHSEDKIGCGLNSIMVDRHPQFRNSRCLFVVRTDGAWEDFSYNKCLQAYIRDKYPSHAERFLREHFRHG